MLKHNPGVICVWTTHEFHLEPQTSGGILLGDAAPKPALTAESGTR